MVLANLLLSMAVTMLIPTLPIWLKEAAGLDNRQVGLVMGSFALGLFLYIFSNLGAKKSSTANMFSTVMV